MDTPLLRQWTSFQTIFWKAIYGQRSLAGYSPRSCKNAGHDLVTRKQQQIPPGTNYAFFLLFSFINSTTLYLQCLSMFQCLTVSSPCSRAGDTEINKKDIKSALRKLILQRDHWTSHWHWSESLPRSLQVEDVTWLVRVLRITSLVK